MVKLLQTFSLILALALGLRAQQQFIENKGQWSEDFDYKYLFPNGSVFLNENSLTVHLMENTATSSAKHGLRLAEEGEEDNLPDSIRHHAYRVHFVGANPNCDFSPSDKLKTYHNYLLGNDPNRWKKRVGLYKAVTYHNIYPNIDLRYYFSKEGNLKYDFVVHPGGDPTVIKLRYEGADDLELVYGNLMVRNSIEDVLESAPYTYQNLEKGKQKVKCSYSLEGDEVSFKVKRYDKKEDLVIDPKLVFSSFTGSSSDNFGFTATPGYDGSLYAGGIVYLAHGSYPVTLGAYQIVNRGGHVDMGISKFNSDGTSLKYSTYVGGGGDDLPYSLYEREDGSLVIMGATGSTNYPASANCYQSNLNAGVAGRSIFADPNKLTFPDGVDIVVTIIDSSGGSMEASTYFGGSWVDGFNIDLNFNYGDLFRGEVIADSSGNIYVASSTFSNDLPSTSNAFRTQWGARQDGFACSFNKDLSNLRWSTFIGGAEGDNALSLKLGPSNNIYVTGATNSQNMALNSDAYQPSGIDGTDGYILNLSCTDGHLINGTYTGSGGRDANFFVDVDHMGDVYVMGQTYGNYPIDTFDTYNNLGSSQFIHKLSGDLKKSKKAMVFGDSTHNQCNISPTAFMVDECRNVYVSGWGGAINGSYQQDTYDMPITNNAIQAQTDGSDFYFFVLDATWKKLNYASYFGGANDDHVDGGTSRFAKDGTIYQAVCGGCGGNNAFPTTANAFSRYNGSSNCNLAALKVDFEALEVVAEVRADQDSSCIPYTANLTNLSYNADSYIWLKPGGAVVNHDLKSIVVDSKGPHSYQLVAIDTTCGFLDTVNLTLHGFEDTVFADFEVQYDSCSNNFKVHTINNSLDADYYLWDFGDGKTSNLKEPVHGYRAEGIYTISLTTKNSYCQLEDSISKVVKFKKRVSSPDFNIRYRPCKDGGSLDFKALGTDFQNYEWDFGDGNTEEGRNVTHTFGESGTYYVKLSLKDTLCQRFYEKDTILEVYTAGYEPVFPNVFTPNGDGRNEYFGLSAKIPKDFFSAFNMKVYNRWGTLLYQTSATDEPWDGTFENNQLAEGVYFYVINLTDGCDNQKEYTGFVHLLNK